VGVGAAKIIFPFLSFLYGKLLVKEPILVEYSLQESLNSRTGPTVIQLRVRAEAAGFLL